MSNDNNDYQIFTSRELNNYAPPGLSARNKNVNIQNQIRIELNDDDESPKTLQSSLNTRKDP